jgi:hypothetical protein
MFSARYTRNLSQINVFNHAVYRNNLFLSLVLMTNHAPKKKTMEVQKCPNQQLVRSAKVQLKL